MASIRLLSDQLINRIAAGEVVERPASVLKELIENSLDAGASRIEIRTEAGGRKLVAVSDNGSGMAADDLLLAVERHATSKLSEDTDLLSIASLGFRGEALPSIGAVSRMTVTSADQTDGQGRRLRLSGGRVLGLDQVSRDRGATVEVRDLFFNVPARKKFLKSVQTEAAHLAETAQRYALARPDLRLDYIHNGQTVLSTSPSEDSLARLARVLGRNTAKSMFPFEGRQNGMVLSGFLGRTDLTRSRANAIYLYVNGRPVQDRLLLRAVLEAYRGRLMSGRYPYAVVFLDIDPGAVDVNVHPTKAQVRFRQPQQVLEAAERIMAQAFPRSNAIAPGGVSQSRPAPVYSFENTGFSRPSVAESWVWVENQGHSPQPAPVQTVEPAPGFPEPRPRYPARSPCNSAPA